MSDKRMSEPDHEDFEMVEKVEGLLSNDATDEQRVARYRLAQVVKLIRLDPTLAESLARYHRLMGILNK